MLKQHYDSEEMVRQQYANTTQYVIPFIEKSQTISDQSVVLEIGCGMGGVLKPFYEKGATCLGVDLAARSIEIANETYSNEIKSGRLRYTTENVLDPDFQNKYTGHFDLIILKDVIEHIYHQEQFLVQLKKLLKPGGQIYFGFPPWYMPFGGHQQICVKKMTSKMPYYHLLPRAIYRSILRLAGEGEPTIQELMNVKDTGISIERFEKIVRRAGFKIINKEWFLFNPIYQFKFGLKPRKQFWLLGAIPFIRNFMTTCAYYTISIK